MLIEIKCDKFREGDSPRPPIEFHSGLNTVIGDAEGGNSIGKSTLLMIIDFVFGGDDYIDKLKDVQDVVLEHTIFFSFQFDKRYNFSRENISKNQVILYDDNWGKLDAWGIQQFRNFLAEKYEIPPERGSFRDVAGRHFRVYNRENIQETRPLNSYYAESRKKALDAFLDLMGLASSLNPMRDVYNRAKDDKLFYEVGRRKGNRLLTTDSEIKDAEKQIEVLSHELNEVEKGFISMPALKIEGLREMEKDLAKFISKRSRARSRIKALQETSDLTTEYKESDFEELQSYFPSINIKRLKDINAFHKSVNGYLQEQIKAEKQELMLQLNFYDSEIERIKTAKDLLSKQFEINSLYGAEKVNIGLEKKKELDALKDCIRDSERYKEAKQDEKDYGEQLKEAKQRLSEKIVSNLNKTMKKMNDFINSGVELTPPKLTIKNDNYEFRTLLDQGAGTQYRGLILYDLAILKESVIPAVIHDSDLLKPVANNPVLGIAKLYKQFTKQIFVAIDKVENYPEEAQKIFLETKVIRLSPDEGALFGRSWNKKKIEDDENK